MTGSISSLLPWVVALLIPPFTGYGLAKLRSAKVRLVMLALLAVMPLFLLLAGMIGPPSSASHVGWMIVTAIIFSPVVLIWAALIGAGYFIGRRTARAAAR